MIDYHGTTALVTGGASGIGKALASALVARGARVILADINADLLATSSGEVGAIESIVTERCGQAARAAHQIGIRDRRSARSRLLQCRHRPR